MVLHAGSKVGIVVDRSVIFQHICRAAHVVKVVCRLPVIRGLSDFPVQPRLLESRSISICIRDLHLLSRLASGTFLRDPADTGHTEIVRILVGDAVSFRIRHA